MSLSLTYKQIEGQLMQETNKKGEEYISSSEAYKALNAMSQANGFSEFNYDIAVELFDRITQQQQVITIDSLANVFAEANELLQWKYQYQQELDVSLQQSKSLLMTLKPNGPTNEIFIDEIIVTGPPNLRPYLIIAIKDQLLESEVAHYENSSYGWIINQNIHLTSLVDDLKIQVMQERNIIGQLTLQCECLPVEVLGEATLPIYLDDEQTQLQMTISCQLTLGNNCQILVNEKIKQLEEKSVQCRDELFILEQQQVELCKPFISANQVNLSSKRSNNDQYRFSAPRYSEQDQINQTPLQVTKQQVNLQHDLFVDPTIYKNSLEYRPSISASVFKQKNEENRTLNNNINKDSYFPSSIQQQQLPYQQQQEEPYLKPQSLQQQHIQSPLSYRQQQLIDNQNQDHDVIYYLLRTDFYATLNLIISFLINFWKYDLITCTIILFLVMIIMLKKKKFLLGLIALVLCSIIEDILQLKYMEIGQYCKMLMILNLLIKSLTIISAGMVYQKDENLMILKSNFLIF